MSFKLCLDFCFATGQNPSNLAKPFNFGIPISASQKTNLSVIANNLSNDVFRDNTVCCSLLDLLHQVPGSSTWPYSILQ